MIILTPQQCIFCKIVDGKVPANIVFTSKDVVAFRPVNPVTHGHILVVPRTHVQNALEHPVTTGKVFKAASTIAPYPCNLITSAGDAADQTVSHFYVHIIPRYFEDGLKLPWSP